MTITLEQIRAFPTVAPDDDSLTRFAPYVSMPPEVRDALVEAVEAARGHLALVTYDQAPQTWNDVNLAAVERLSAALAAFAPEASR